MTTNILNKENRMSETQLAEYWSVKRSTLQKWRSLGTGPVYIKIGGKVAYPIESIVQFERGRTFRGTADRVFPNE